MIDGIGKRQPAEREHADYWNAVVNKCLELFDGAVKSEGVIVIGATNRPDDIDEAIKRSGRLETHIEIPKPDVLTLAGILAHHLGPDLAILAASAKRGGKDDPAPVHTLGDVMLETDEDQRRDTVIRAPMLEHPGQEEGKGGGA